MKQWTVNPGSNEYLQGDGFHVSYNPDVGSNPMLKAMESLRLAGEAALGLPAKAQGTEETALCRGGQYLILNGDFRSEYAAVFDQGYEACLEVYNRHKAEHRSPWSSERLEELRGKAESDETLE